MTFIGLCVVVILSVSAAKGKHLFSQFSAVRAVGECIRILTTYFHLFLVALNWNRPVQWMSCLCEWCLVSLCCIGRESSCFFIFFFRRVGAGEEWWALAKCGTDLDSSLLLAIHSSSWFWVQHPLLPWSPFSKVTRTYEFYVSVLTPRPWLCCSPLLLCFLQFSFLSSSSLLLPNPSFHNCYFRKCWRWIWLAFLTLHIIPE